MKKLLLLSIIALLAFSSCKKWQHKYPEDPERTKLTPEERITGRWWTLQSTSLNGVDYTDSVKQKFGKYQIYFSKDEYDSGIWPDIRYYAYLKTEIEPEFTAIWRFTENETLFTIGRLVNNFPFYSIMPCYMDYNIFLSPYTILRMTENDFKFTRQNINKDTTISYNFISD